MAVKIRLKRLGKVRVPQYRIVVVDSRKKRDGKVIEEIGKYHPKEDPSYISVVSDRAQYWLGVGAQPSDAVAKLLKITGDWQTFKGYQGTEGTLQDRRGQARQARHLQQGPGRRARHRLRRGRDQEGRRQEGCAQGRGAKAEAKAETEGRGPEGRGRLPRLSRGRAEAEAPADEAPAEEAAPVPADETPEGAAADAEEAETAESTPTRPDELSVVLADALEHLVRGVVDHPDDVVVRDKQLRRGSILEVRVHPDDLGKVIGRGGRTATAFRTVISALAGKDGARIDFVDVDRRR